jgi:putative oxidoreductase
MTTLDTRLNSYSPAVVSLFRAVFGFLFAAFGSSKLFGWPIALGPIPVGTWPVWYAGVIELVTGLLVLVGLFTRIAAFIASGEMAVAYFWQHQPYGLWPIDPTQNATGQPIGGGLPSVLFCFAFFLLVFTGPGAYALDSMRRRVRR